MAQKKATRFSQEPIAKLGKARDFAEWNRRFEDLKHTINLRISPRDIQPLLNAGAENDQLLTWLAFVVLDSAGLSPKLMENRKDLAKLATDMDDIVRRTTRIVSDPRSDGRFWLALEGELPWDQVPKSGVIEARVLEHMRAFARLIRDRGELLGRDSTLLRKIVRKRSLRNLIAYVVSSTNRNLDAEIAYLLAAAHIAARLEKQFTADQIKKFRQRHIATPSNPRKNNLRIPSALPAAGLETSFAARQPFRRKTFGERIAQACAKS